MSDRNMNQEEDKSYFINLNLKIAHYLFIILLGGQFLMVAFGVILVGERGVFFTKEASESALYQLLPIISIGAVLLAWYIQKFRMERLNKNLPTLKKVHHFRDTALMQAVFLEAANIFAIMVAIVTYTNLPYLFFGLGLMAFLWAYPSRRRFEREYGESLEV
ncbi:MAG: hypothetical protein KDC24_03945 [Saprospiraceae bacterium]|nr:hypothetical protein [Saprospiraceae bacterium]